MKVRARVKAPEYLPEWAKCCRESIAEIAQAGEMTVDLAATKDLRNGACRHCGKRYPTDLSGPLILSGDKAGLYAPFGLLDLDEGPMESGAALSGERA